MAVRSPWSVYGVHVELDPDRRVPADPVLVDVHHGGRWWPGQLLEWQRWDTGWRAYCLWSVAPGERYLKWVNGDRVRPREASRPGGAGVTDTP